VAAHRVSPQAEIRGSIILTTIEALEGYADNGKRILAELGIKDLQAEQWYPQQAYIDFFESLRQRTGPSTLFVIGKRIAEIVTFPPQINSLEKLLRQLNYFYQQDRRHCNPDEGWRYESTGARSATMTIVSPYPDDYERGVLEGFVRKFKPTDSYGIRVLYDETKPRNDHQGGSTTLLVTW